MEPPRPATLSDVASEAGVSLATASKALNDRFDVSDSTRTRVRDVASRLRFTPNALARGLKAGKSHTVGIITNDLSGRFVSEIMSGAELALGFEQSIVLLTNSRGDPRQQQQHLNALLQRRVDGLIVVDEQMEEREPIKGAEGVPTVYVFGFSSNPKDVSVIPDIRRGGQLAVEHLLKSGRTRIAHLAGPRNSYSGRERAAGFRDAAQAAGVLNEQLIVDGEYSEGSAWSRVEGLLERGQQFDAVFAANDQIARGAIERLQYAGRRVPEDVAVVGYDNWSVLARDGRTPITSVDMQLDALGAEAVRQLFDTGDATPGRILVPPTLQIRASTRS